MDKSEIVEYWLKSAEEDYKMVRELLILKHYVYSLFFCHLAIEKILKALVVKKTKKHAPYIHNLTRLAEIAGLEISELQYDALFEISTFNIKARYDDYKLNFYKKATKEYTKKYFEETTNLYLWLKKQ